LEALGIVLIGAERLDVIDEMLRTFPCVRILSTHEAATWAEASAAVAGDSAIKIVGRLGRWTYLFDTELRLPGEARACAALACQTATQVIAIAANDDLHSYYLGVHDATSSRTYLETTKGILEDRGPRSPWEVGRPESGWTLASLGQALRSVGIDVDQISSAGPYVLKRTAEALPPPMPLYEPDPLEELQRADDEHRQHEEEAREEYEREMERRLERDRER
jgi:hypothetical protein